MISLYHHTTYYKSLFIGLVFFLHQTTAFSQHYPTLQYTTKDGLGQLQILSTLEDSRGYIWVGHKGGLSKFDGQNFENFNQSDGMLRNFVTHLFEDSKGQIWFSYGKSGIGCFDGANFKNYKTQTVGEYASPIEFNKDVYFINRDSVFVIKDEVIKFVTNIWPDAEDKAHPRLFYRSTDHQLMAYRNKNLFRFNHESKEFEPITSVNYEIGGVSIQEGNIYISGSLGGKSFHSLLKGSQVIPILESENNGLKILNSTTHPFIFSHNSQTYLLEENGRKYTKISDFYGSFGSITNYKTKKGRIYFGTEKGLFCVFVNGFKYFKESEVPYAWSVTEGKKGEIYISSYGYDLQKWDENKLVYLRDYQKYAINKYEELTNSRINNNSLNSWYYRSLRDHRGKLWFPNFSGALIKDIGAYNYFSNQKSIKSDKANFFYLAEDPFRNKIIAAGLGGAICIENKGPYTYYPIIDSTDMFSNNAIILCTMVDQEHNYWFGGKGICRYYPEKKTFEYYKFDTDKDIRIAELIQDSKGRIWAGTFFNGLYLFNPKSKTFERVFENILDGPSYFLGEYNAENLMVGDNRNLYIINTKSLKKTEVFSFNYNNGFIGEEPGQAGFFKDSKNRIWITSGSVLSFLDTKKLELKSGESQVFIRTLNGKLLPFQNSNNVFNLTKNKNTLNIRVEAVGTDKSFNPQFSFKIPGIIENWSEWSESNLLTIPNLSNGTHQIIIRSNRGLSSSNNHPETSILFKVSIPFYKSPDFHKLVILVGSFFMLLLLFLVYLGRKQKQTLKKQLVHIKRQEQKVRMLQVQTSQAQMNPHFTFNVLGTIQNMILNQKTELANTNLIKLSNLIRNFLEASLIPETDEASLISMEIPLEKEIELLKMYLDFELLQYQNKFEYKIITHPSLDIPNYQIPPMLLQPFVENAIKHGLLYKNEKGALSIAFIPCGEDCLKITITDNGVGIEEAKEIQKAKLRAYKSRGTELVKKRIAILNELDYNISLSIKSDKEGTIIELTIDYKE